MDVIDLYALIFYYINHSVFEVNSGEYIVTDIDLCWLIFYCINHSINEILFPKGR